MTEKELKDIVNALNSGVVPRSGAEYLMVGRDRIVQQFDIDLKNVKDGLSMTKFIVGNYGTGKSFVQAILTQKAYSYNFVVSKVDLSPYRRLYSKDGYSREFYTEVVKNMTTSTCRTNAIVNIIEQWITKHIEALSSDPNFDLTKKRYVEMIIKNMTKEIKEIDNFFGGADFSNVLALYLRSYISGDEETQKSCIKWISGEYKNISSAKQELPVTSFISDDNYYEYLKLINKFVVIAGYSGFLINIDELVNLYKISHKGTRDKNYEMILRIFNDTLQSDVDHLFITLSTTPSYLEDEYKGVFSYEALKRRLVGNRFENDNLVDYNQPVIRLNSLNNKETFLLIKRLINIHELYYNYTSTIKDDDIIMYVESKINDINKNSITVGEIVKEFFGVLNIMHDNQLSLYDVLSANEKNNSSNSSSADDILDRFGKL